MVVHPHANAFDNAADEYERGRPGYPAALLDWINALRPLDGSSTIVDLGAGTGKLTRLLVGSPARVIAVEPLPAMRETFARVLPGTELIDATAQSMPLEDASVDIVACGQSFRWFATEAALAEIARVLRPGGELLLIFNGNGEASPVQRRLSELLQVADTETTEKKPGLDWREVLAATERFRIIEEVEISNPHFVSREGVVDRLRSSSQFSRLAPARQEELLSDIGGLIEGDLADLSQVTRVTALRRLGD
ncbi:MAG TPA: class I SAM-dependent methyltransferase [Acidimicrobiales bacterium]|nr:class I SAM-dependent methyltransferase [Acidimicrobiales bacterium]